MISTVTGASPRGVLQCITPEQYAELSENDKRYYSPTYSKYKIRKVRDYQYCDLGCRHYMGWIEERTPVGDPCEYYYNIMLPIVTDSILKSNIIVKRSGLSPISGRA